VGGLETLTFRWREALKTSEGVAMEDGAVQPPEPSRQREPCYLHVIIVRILFKIHDLLELIINVG